MLLKKQKGWHKEQKLPIAKRRRKQLKQSLTNKEIFIDRFYQEYLSEKHAYGETFKTKATWQKENKDFINKKYAEENSES